MAFRLARDHGVLDVDAMLEWMPAPLFAEWCEFYSREPMPEAFYLGFAGLAVSVARMLGVKNPKIEDFMIRFSETSGKKKEMSSDDMEAVFRAMALAHNETVKNG